MKNRYLKSLTARVATLMLFFLCLAGSQGAGAQTPMERRSGSSASVVSPQKPVMPRMTKSGGNAVSVNGTEYDTWANAVAAINSNATETSFDIVLLNHVMDAKIMPSKACTISGSTSSINFAYIDENNKLTRIQMLAPLTFKNIALQISQIAANGHALTFDEGVTVVSQYSSGENNITGIRNIWGGTDSSSDVASSDITIKSGQFGWILGGSGSSGAVTGTAKVTMTGGTVNGTIFGGGYEGTCGNTEVVMSGGTTRWIYGGGEKGNVTNVAKLTISGDALITETVFGGCDSGTCGSTEVKLSGGSFTGNIYGGGFNGIVSGKVSLEVDGAHIVPTKIGDGVYSGGGIHGGGFGEESAENDNGKVGSTEVLIKSLAADSHNVSVFGGGLYADVGGNTQVTVEGGNINAVYGAGYNYNNTSGSVAGNVDVLIKGGIIETVGAARGQDSGKSVPVGGNMNITIEGGEVTYMIQSGNEPHGSEYKSCTLTIRNTGSESAPFTLPGIYAITDLVLENSNVKQLTSVPTGLYSIVLDKDHPLNISGDGKLIGTGILLDKFGPENLPENLPVVIASNLPEATTFAKFVKMDAGSVVTSPAYKAGNTYRLKKDSETLYTVNITEPDRKLGTLSVVWDKVNGQDVELEDGDQTPANTRLTVTATPANGYRLETITVTPKDGQGVALANNGIYEMPENEVTFQAIFKSTYVPPVPTYYAVTLPEVEGVTTNPKAGTRTVEEGYSFSFTLTLEEGYESSEPVVKANGILVEPRESDGKYIIRNIEEDTEITIEGIVKNDPTGNAVIESEVKVQAVGSALYVYLPKAETIRIYTLSGLLYKEQALSAGDTQIQLSGGLYLVKIGDKTYKTVIR